MDSVTNANNITLAEKLSTIAKRRPRTTPEQSRILNTHFARNPVPSKNEIKLIAREVKIKPRSTHFWYQNKRASVKREGRKSKEKTQEEAMPKTKKTRRDPNHLPQVSGGYQQNRLDEFNVADQRSSEDKEPKKRVTFYSPAVAQYQQRAFKLPEMTPTTPVSVQQCAQYSAQPRLPPLASLLAHPSHLPLPNHSPNSVMGVPDFNNQLPRVNIQQQHVDPYASTNIPFFFYHVEFGFEASVSQLHQQRNQ
ncbi:Homeodomain-like DNA binding domain-containing transcription factor [Phycomyces blakesleeanus]|uniref:Homeodomain-like DNA binding domain-containing transcription factor n=2 Tax=Phycomyces blakesleeanus TaxID=4837 RepID=A0A167NJV3_PHYB8|nr:Homeodomain-like DNA binding domain-containing transcription factor [Phycomyces blakesleeanus NRRL 1555(-)]OAD76100.1 Homeodomain-like DNA binding domain-containing transcription factor [Phycomyces blakesleeanus NRRL 1555(-)]|eukprot:XP_018294140.1 Homeodomain-like DNA binding domain-containing transcription factor [Phycomyces blakesleeanus NRRL 1555(-)]